MTQQPTNNGAIPWFAEALRLTAFPSPSAQIDTSTLWESVVGQKPDNQNIQPKLGIRQEDGLLEGGKLILNVQPARVEWLFTTAYDQEANGPAFEQLPNFTTGLDIFIKVIDRWFVKSPLLSRLAFGAVLIIPVENRALGYEKITSFLPDIKIDPYNSSDFLYQINRPRESKQIKGLKINRLCKWSVAMTTLTQFVLGPRISPIAIPESQRLLARLELDINTAAEFSGELSSNQTESLFQELISLGKEIAANGDVP